MRSVNEWFEAIERVSGQDTGPKAQHTDSGGNLRSHGFVCNDERYRVDFADDFTTEGWQQFDTHQDAPYFGLWVNGRNFRTLCYCEGDWTAVQCPDEEHYRQQITELLAIFPPAKYATGIDIEAGTVTHFYQDRAELLKTAGEPSTDAP